MEPDRPHTLTPEDRLQLALSAARMGIWEWEIEPDTVRWSPEVEAIFGFAPGAFPPTFEAFAMVVHTDDREMLTHEVRTALADPSYRYDVMHRAQRRDGSELWLHCTGLVQRAADGSPIRMVGTVADITLRKALEAQLQQAQKMESIGRLAGGIAHDFNNLLTVILGELDIMQIQGSVPKHLEESLANVRDAAQRGHHLTRQLLNFARQEPLRIAAVDVRATLRAIEGMLSRIAGPRIAITLQIEDGLRPANTDPTQLGQVLMNLAVNAIDAMPNGGRLTIQARNDDIGTAREATGRRVRISVTDTGAGMPDAVRKRLFEPFFTTKKSGTGLGLATSFRMVTACGGTIEVETATDKGSSFHVLLPSPDPATASAADTRTPTVVLPRPERERVLLVEDDDMVRSVAKRALERAGFAVQAVADADQACAAIDRTTFDLVITDVVMPGCDGVMLAETIRHRAAGTRILLMSGYREHTGTMSEEDRRGFLAKPFTPRTLTAKAREILDEGLSHGAAPTAR